MARSSVKVCQSRLSQGFSVAASPRRRLRRPAEALARAGRGCNAAASPPASAGANLAGCSAPRGSTSCIGRPAWWCWWQPRIPWGTRATGRSRTRRGTHWASQAMDVGTRTEGSHAALCTCRWRGNPHRSGAPWADCSCWASSPATAVAATAAATTTVAAGSWQSCWRRMPGSSPGTSVRDRLHPSGAPVHKRRSVDIVFILEALQHASCTAVRYGAACGGVFQAGEDPIDAVGQRSEADDAPEVAHWQA